MRVLYGNMGELLHHRRCIISPAPAVCMEATEGEQKQEFCRRTVYCMSIARNGWCVSVTIEVNIKVTAVMPAFFTPPGSVPAPSRRRRWNVMKLNCSQPPFAASIRHCPGLLSSFQSLFLSADRQFCWNLPLAVLRCAWVWVCVCGCVSVCACGCVVGGCIRVDLLSFSQSFLMPICRELPRFRVCRAVWQLQFIQT